MARTASCAAAAVAAAIALAGCGAGGQRQDSQPPRTGWNVSHPAAGGFRPDKTTIAGCGSSDFRCYEQAFGNLTYRAGPERALVVLGRMLQANVPAVRGDCHTITHLIGSAALARFHGNATKAIAHGSMICGSGFYHGLIEYALRGTSTRRQLIAKVRAICSDRTLLDTTFLRYQCVHGLGHGLMIFSGDNLPFALSMCDELADRWSQQSCSGGVFMQNFNPPSRLSPFRSRYVKTSDLLYPCDWVRERYKYYCYLQITEHVLSVTGYDWKRAASTCARAAHPWDAICFQSFGRDASGASRYEPAAAYRYCLLTGSHLADCVYGVVRDFANNDTNGKRAARFCGLVPARLEGYCFYGIGTILGTFGMDGAQIARACRALSSRYARECLGVLTASERRLLTELPA
jgi:hypothetical protein